MDRLQALRDAGVSIWLDTLTRDLLESGEFARLIADCSVTGATSNPTIFAAAMTGSMSYDHQLQQLLAAGDRDTREMFLALAVADVQHAAELLWPSRGDSKTGLGKGDRSAASPRSRRSSCPASTPRQTRCCPRGSSLRGTVAVANAAAAYALHTQEMVGQRWQRLAEAGALPQRPLWASTGTKNPAYSDVLYVESLIGPGVVNTMPRATLEAFADHGDATPTLAGSRRRGGRRPRPHHR